MPHSSSYSPSIQFSSVTAGYHKHDPLFSDYSLTLHGAGLSRLTGKNGTGKSTFVELASGYLRPWAGSITINDEPVSSDAARITRRICRTQPAIYPAMTTSDHIMFVSHSQGSDPEEGFSRLTRYGLDSLMHTNAGELSTGNLRKLWIVMTTMGEFSFAILDEPYIGLDDVGVDVLNKELSLWKKSRRILAIAHDPPHGFDATDIITLDHKLSAS